MIFKVPNAEAPLFLMCPPDYFSLSASDPLHGFANDMIAHAYEAFIQDPAGFKEKAFVQWAALKDTLLRLGANIELLAPQPHLQDQVFTADASLSFIRRDGSELSLMSTMTHPLRQKEGAEHLKKIQTLFPSRHIHMNSIASEGSGDNLYDPYRNLFWSGYTPNPSRTRAAEGRSDIKSHAHLSQLTGVKVVSLEVKRPYFHIDTALSALPGGHLLCYPGGMTHASFKTLIEEAFINFNMDPNDYLIEISEAEASRYACNMVYVGNQIVLPHCEDRVYKLLTEKGYEVHTVDLSCFIQAGGGPHCLTNNLNLRETQ
jgi:N-dimethylarginine dimethylaminohydrolase